jgi:hypothetical protein
MAADQIFVLCLIVACITIVTLAERHSRRRHRAEQSREEVSGRK